MLVKITFNSFFSQVLVQMLIEVATGVVRRTWRRGGNLLFNRRVFVVIFRSNWNHGGKTVLVRGSLAGSGGIIVWSKAGIKLFDKVLGSWEIVGSGGSGSFGRPALVGLHERLGIPQSNWANLLSSSSLCLKALGG